MKTKVLMVLTVLLAASGELAASWDCGADFNTLSNPAGVWSYRTGNGTLMISGNGNLGNPPVGWQSPSESWVGLYGYPGGDLVDPNDFGGHNPWIVRWTSPYAGWIQISGRSYQRSYDSGARLMKWTLRHNGVEFNHGYGKQNPSTGIALLGSTNAASFADGVGGAGGLYRQVAVGDTIELLTAGTPAAEWPIPYAGAQPWGTANLCQFKITAIAEPPTFSLTVVAEPAIVGVNVSPAPGVYQYVAGSPAPIVAVTPYIDCPTLMAFDHWTGDGVANPAAASTTVDMSNDRTVTAVFVDARQCGDVCHPTWPDVPTDLNSDCVIDIGDLAVMAQSWLDSTHPDDD